MPTPPKSLNALVPWSWLLDVLGVAVPSQILPAVVLRCPLCQHEQLTIVEDYLAGGEWFHCRNCKQSGDMIELAAKVWKLSIVGTVRKLNQQGFDLPTDLETIRGYLVEHANYRKRLNRLWQQAQPYLHQQSTTLRSLLSELQLPDEFSPERWSAGPAKIVGGARCDVIEQTFSPGSMRTAASSETAVCTSSARTFKGGGWQEALIIPFFAAPARICAFGFVGRRGNMTRDFVFRCARVTVASPPQHHEAGLAMHPDVHEMAINWRRTVFAVSDPLTYLQLQLRQFAQSNSPLPLVLWQDSPDGKMYVRTRLAWEMFRDCRVVFWDPTMSLTTVRQAIAINGWIATCGPRRNEEENLHNYVYRAAPTALCRDLQKQARPWPKALAAAMPKWTDARIEDIFLQLQLDAPQIEKVRKACPPELLKRFDAVLNPSRQIQRFIRFDNRIVVERRDGLYCHRNKNDGYHLELLCNAQLRLAQVVTYKRTGRTFYAGTVLFHGEEIPFVAPQKEFEKSAFGWLRKFLLQQGKGLLNYNQHWGPNAISVAAQLHPPEIIDGLDVVGWDQKTCAFRIPGWSIGLHGVRKLPAYGDESVLPAANLKYSSEPLPTNWHEMGDEYSLSLFWGALAGVLSNILAPVLFQETRGIGLVGEGAQKMGLAVAKAAGCLIQEIGGIKSVRAAIEIEQNHRWPVCAPIVSEWWRPAVSKWIEGDRTYPRNCITGPMDEDIVAELEDSGRWSFVVGMKSIPLRCEIENWPLLKMVRRLVPQYLADVCRRSLQVEDVLEDLTEFVARSRSRGAVGKVEDVLCHEQDGQGEATTVVRSAAIA